jgi:hypothetical protein
MENTAELNFNQQLFRCSLLSKFIIEEKENKDGSIRKGSGTITEGIQTALKEIYYQKTKGYKKDFGSKQTEKGNYCEEDGITMLQKTIMKGKLLVKNKEIVMNDWLAGTHDVKIGNVIVDIKNSFDWLTFDVAEMSKIYEWQLRGYMMLNDCSEALLYYCLLNMPEQLLQDEERKMFYSKKKWMSFESPDYLLECDKLREMFNFEKYPIEQRFKVFKIERDLAKEELIKSSIVKCRTWLNDYHEQQLELAKNNLILMQ